MKKSHKATRKPTHAPTAKVAAEAPAQRRRGPRTWQQKAASVIVGLIVLSFLVGMLLPLLATP